jgi:speckle-type POZ protein
MSQGRNKRKVGASDGDSSNNRGENTSNRNKNNNLVHDVNIKHNIKKKSSNNNNKNDSNWLDDWSQRNLDISNSSTASSSLTTRNTTRTAGASLLPPSPAISGNINSGGSTRSLTTHFMRRATGSQRRNTTVQRVDNNNNNTNRSNAGNTHLGLAEPSTRPKKTSKKGPIQPADYNFNDSHELRTETVTDTHHVHKVWTIKNWSGIPQNEGYILYDQEFSFVGHRWRLRLYPGGVTEQVKGYMSFYLDCRDATDEHPAHERHTFRVVNQLNPSKHWEQHSLPYKEHRDPDGWGWGKFLSHEYLKEEAQGYRINDTIIFELELYVYGEKKNIVTRELSRREVPKKLVVDVPNSTLSFDMNKLFNEDKFSDIVFLVGNVEFPAHKCILSVRSPMLYAMFSTSGMRETREEKVSVEDIEPDIFREVLRFIYTGVCSLDILDRMPIQLLAAADKYQIIRLKCMCENRLFKRMTVTDCADVLVAADMHNADALYQRCLSFMTESAEKVKEVMETDAFKYLADTRPKLMIAIMHAMSEEDIVMTPSKKRLLNLEQQQLKLQSLAGGSGNKRQRVR